MPRAATSVATSTENWPRRNCASVASRCDWPMSPWSTCAERRPNAGPPASSSHSRFVEVKTITRPPPPWASSDDWPRRCESSTEMMSSSSEARASFDRGTSTALCDTVVAACWRESPTTSTKTGFSRYFCVSLRTHDGDVAENNSVCGRTWSSTSSPTSSAAAGASPNSSSRSKPGGAADRDADLARPTPWRAPAGHSPKMRSTSSAKPMDSISSASSRTTWYADERSRLPRSMWSMTRPTVATRTSTPRRSAPSWGPYDTPPWKQIVEKPCVSARSLSSASTCFASSRVGASTRIAGPRPRFRASYLPCFLSSARRSTRGRPKANVLPVPVRDFPSKSRPAKTSS
mmetsp:Transcript_27459/g.84742  ORF Transcript_27459/g.84742 Transcript_27459/m.84742 type:complete len:346 (-) Transcript_27459:543-1580(-)